jgi:hypothetical protein
MPILRVALSVNKDSAQDKKLTVQTAIKENSLLSSLHKFKLIFKIGQRLKSARINLAFLLLIN